MSGRKNGLINSRGIQLYQGLGVRIQGLGDVGKKERTLKQQRFPDCINIVEWEVVEELRIENGELRINDVQTERT